MHLHFQNESEKVSNAARKWLLIAVTTRGFTLCGKKHGQIYSNAYTSLKNPSLVSDCVTNVPEWIAYSNYPLTGFFPHSIKLRDLLEYVYAGLWEYERIFGAELFLCWTVKDLFSFRLLKNLLIFSKSPYQKWIKRLLARRLTNIFQRWYLYHLARLSSLRGIAHNCNMP